MSYGMNKHDRLYICRELMAAEKRYARLTIVIDYLRRRINEENRDPRDWPEYAASYRRDEEKQ